MRVLLFLVALAVHPSIDLLGLAGAPVGPGAPPGWNVRLVRGQRAPSIEVAGNGEGPLLRLHGAGQAAWFYRELAQPLPDSGGVLKWSWRVLQAPDNADMRTEALDDSPIRVYVVFRTGGFFRNASRIIFYTFGNAEPEGFARRSFVSDKLHTVRVDGAGERGRWREHSVDPFADYRRIWGDTPPAISAIGVMQDTDQTRAPATAELRLLEWSTR